MSYEGTTGKAGAHPCCPHCDHPRQAPALLHEKPCLDCLADDLVWHLLAAAEEYPGPARVLAIVARTPYLKAAA